MPDRYGSDPCCYKEGKGDTEKVSQKTGNSGKGTSGSGEGLGDKSFENYEGGIVWQSTNAMYVGMFLTKRNREFLFQS